jgi:hypothetical protein
MDMLAQARRRGDPGTRVLEDREQKLGELAGRVLTVEMIRDGAEIRITTVGALDQGKGFSIMLTAPAPRHTDLAQTLAGVIKSFERLKVELKTFESREHGLRITYPPDMTARSDFAEITGAGPIFSLKMPLGSLTVRRESTRPRPDVTLEQAAPVIAKAVAAEWGAKSIESHPATLAGLPARRLTYIWEPKADGNNATSARFRGDAYVFIRNNRTYGVYVLVAPSSYEALMPMFQKVLDSVEFIDDKEPRK